MLSFFGSSVVAGAMTFAISGWARTLGEFVYDGGKYLLSISRKKKEEQYGESPK